MSSNEVNYDINFYSLEELINILGLTIPARKRQVENAIAYQGYHVWRLGSSDEGKCNSSQLTPTYLSPDSSCTTGGAMIKWATARAEMSARIETLNNLGSVKLCKNGICECHSLTVTN